MEIVSDTSRCHEWTHAANQCRRDWDACSYCDGCCGRLTGDDARAGFNLGPDHRHQYVYISAGDGRAWFPEVRTIYRPGGEPEWEVSRTNYFDPCMTAIWWGEFSAAHHGRELLRLLDVRLNPSDKPWPS